jgi:hypothetical protein
MAVIGSEEWCAQELARGAALPEQRGRDARLSFTALGGPDGDVSWHVRVEDGRLVEVAPGADPDASSLVTLPWADAEAIDAGSLDANAAFMQGRLKSAGATAPLLTWLSLQQNLR